MKGNFTFNSSAVFSPNISSYKYPAWKSSSTTVLSFLFFLKKLLHSLMAIRYNHEENGRPLTWYFDKPTRAFKKTCDVISADKCFSGTRCNTNKKILL